MVCLRNMCVDTLHKGDNDDDDDDDDNNNNNNSNNFPRKDCNERYCTFSSTFRVIVAENAMTSK